jgi:HSP20 family protein
MSTNLAILPDIRPLRMLSDDWPFGRFLESFREADPAIRVEETVENGTLIIKAEAPGIDPEKDVDISMSNGKLFISMERRLNSETEKNGATRSEFRYGSFARTITLPEGTQTADVKATYKDGILEVRVPTPKPAAEPVKVPISRESGKPAEQ